MFGTPLGHPHHNPDVVRCSAHPRRSPEETQGSAANPPSSGEAAPCLPSGGCRGGVSHCITNGAPISNSEVEDQMARRSTQPRKARHKSSHSGERAAHLHGVPHLRLVFRCIFPFSLHATACPTPAPASSAEAPEWSSSTCGGGHPRLTGWTEKWALPRRQLQPRAGHATPPGLEQVSAGPGHATLPARSRARPDSWGLPWTQTTHSSSRRPRTRRAKARGRQRERGLSRLGHET